MLSLEIAGSDLLPAEDPLRAASDLRVLVLKTVRVVLLGSDSGRGNALARVSKSEFLPEVDAAGCSDLSSKDINGTVTSTEKSTR